MIKFFYLFLMFFSTGLTASYSFRLFYYSMSGDNNFYSSFAFKDTGYYISLGVISLLFVAVFGGTLLSWLIFPIRYVIVLPFYLKFLTILVVCLGSYLGYLISDFSFFYDLFSLNFCSSVWFSGSVWIMHFLSTNFISFYPLNLSYYSSKVFDYGWGEMFGGQGMYNLFIYMINYIQNLYDLNFKIYLLTFIFWMFILLMLFLS